MTQLDLGPAALRLAELVYNVPDDVLDQPTPCPDYTLGDLVDHVGGLSLAFAAAAKKQDNELTNHAPFGRRVAARRRLAHAHPA